MEILSIVLVILIGIAILTVKCAWTNSPDVCNRSLTCDGRNTETNTNFFYYNNSCQLVPSNCHFSTDINTSSYLFEICIAVCSNATGDHGNHGDSLNLFVVIPSSAGGALFILVVVIVTIIIIRRRSRYKAKKYYEQVLAMINDDANDYDDYDDDDGDDSNDAINDDVIK